MQDDSQLIKRTFYIKLHKVYSIQIHIYNKESQTDKEDAELREGKEVKGRKDGQRKNLKRIETWCRTHGRAW